MNLSRQRYFGVNPVIALPLHPEEVNQQAIRDHNARHGAEGENGELTLQHIWLAGKELSHRKALCHEPFQQDLPRPKSQDVLEAASDGESRVANRDATRHQYTSNDEDYRNPARIHFQRH